MRPLSEASEVSGILRCACGSALFFDWGLRIAYEPRYRNPRWEGWQTANHVRVCARCLLPMVESDGELFDASEYVGREEIARLFGRMAALALPREERPLEVSAEIDRALALPPPGAP